MGNAQAKQDLEVLKRTTKYTEAELKEWREAFMALYPEGYIERDDFSMVFNNILVDKCFKRNPNGNPEVNLDTFVLFKSLFNSLLRLPEYRNRRIIGHYR